MERDAKDKVEVLRSRLLGDIPHGFLGRRGGVSEGIHAGLNVGLGSDDDREAILANRRRAATRPAAATGLRRNHSGEAA